MNTAAYTIGQLSRAVGISRQAIAKRIERTAPGARAMVDGKEVDAWSFESLPLEWKLETTRRGVNRGFENGEIFLASLPAVPWKAPLPWDRVSPREQAKAVKLQKAMARALELRSVPATAAGQVEAAGLEDFKAGFGYVISSRHWHRLLARTLDRDGGEENWQRLEIYLDDRVFAVAKPKREELGNEYQHRELDEVFPAMENRQAPTPEDRAILWDGVFQHYEQHTDALTDSPQGNRERRLFKASLVGYLFRVFPAGAMCATAKSLRNRFDEKIVLWREGGRAPQALADKRPENSGKPGRKLCPTCRPVVKGGAVDLDGDLSQAWRRLNLAGKLCAQCAPPGSFDVRRRKSDVPKWVRADVMPDILAALPYRRGPKHARLVSPYVRRDPNDIGPGDWAECDDMTPNHVTHGCVDVLTWDQDSSGQPFIGRMELLVQIDQRTTYPWAYVIILGDPATSLTPQRKATYNSVHCRLLFLRGHDQLGMPHLGYHLENSVWRSRLIDGPRMQHWDSSPWKSTELGLCDPRIGLRVRHALPGNPRSKVIERVFLSIQNGMRCQPGFLGFNERQDKREKLDDFIRRVKAGKEHPGNEVPQVAEFCKLLDAEFMAYAAEPQNGTRLPGVSPMEAFHGGIGGHPGIKERPLRNLGANARFLLSSHERLLPVTSQGIRFKVGNSEFVFWGPELEPFQHQQIIARFNFEQPELLTCQAPNGEPFTVKARILPSMTATKKQLAEAGSARASWMRRGKVIYDTLPHPFRTLITRDNDQSEETKEFGRFHNAEAEKFKEEQSETARSVKHARKKAIEAGFDPAHLRLKNPERVAEAAGRIADRFEALRQKEAQRETQETSNE